MKIISRGDAISLNLIRYFTGKACKNGHMSERFVKRRQCVECNRIAAAERIKQDPQTNRDKVRKWATSNPEKAKASARRRYEKEMRTNPELRRERGRTWAKENPGKARNIVARRRAAKAQRTPAWLTQTDFAEIQFTYEYCAALRAIGLDYHVDHVIPLRGRNVSGLHVPSNLQVLHAADNMTKANTFEVVT